jgi:hypothetical protein
MVSMLENLSGVAALMEEYNGLEKNTHNLGKLGWMTQVTGKPSRS